MSILHVSAFDKLYVLIMLCAILTVKTVKRVWPIRGSALVHIKLSITLNKYMTFIVLLSERHFTDKT